MFAIFLLFLASPTGIATCRAGRLVRCRVAGAMNRPELIVDGENVLQENGSLELSAPWVDWKRGDTRISLDGFFTAAELRAIADHVDRYGVVLL